MPIIVRLLRVWLKICRCNGAAPMILTMPLTEQHVLTSVILATTFIGLTALWILLGKIVADELKRH
jgi:hypothetical protein